ncbi:hypothetical protein EVAR_14469_1 [Eumeta japonica]|uniref:Uncharacterized protein n=1 Tax=Eumeta variegata TaxID=151549 RepID=A0A4C1U3V6_EUMVA|nr:hypothetical protein EVAR_14469_1 [Eumeta japonica]
MNSLSTFASPFKSKQDSRIAYRTSKPEPSALEERITCAAGVEKSAFKGNVSNTTDDTDDGEKDRQERLYQISQSHKSLAIHATGDEDRTFANGQCVSSYRTSHLRAPVHTWDPGFQYEFYVNLEVHMMEYKGEKHTPSWLQNDLEVAATY